MIVYIAGKISGNPEYKKQFAAAAARLRQQGLEVINPAVLPQMEYHRYPPINLAMIDAADGLLLLPGWEHSTGAAWEAAYARRMGKTIFKEQS